MTAEIRQKKWQNRGVESFKLFGIILVSSVKVSQLNKYTSFYTIAETLIKQVLPVSHKILRIYSMKFSVCGEVFFKSVSAIGAKKVSLLYYKLTAKKLSGHKAWAEYTCVIEFQLSLR